MEWYHFKRKGSREVKLPVLLKPPVSYHKISTVQFSIIIFIFIYRGVLLSKVNLGGQLAASLLLDTMHLQDDPSID